MGLEPTISCLGSKRSNVFGRSKYKNPPYSATGICLRYKLYQFICRAIIPVSNYFYCIGRGNSRLGRSHIAG